MRTAVEIDGRRMALGLPAEIFRGLPSSSPTAPPAAAAPEPVDPSMVAAPIAGTLPSWKVADGDTVNEGDAIATIEAMKMEMQVVAHRTGRLLRQAVQGAYLAAGTPIAQIAEDG